MIHNLLQVLLYIDVKKILNKSPTIEDALEVVSSDCDSEEFRKQLKLPLAVDLREAMKYWITNEPSDVTWRNLVQALKLTSQTSQARFLVQSYLIRPNVYTKYINKQDFESFADLGIL